MIKLFKKGFTLIELLIVISIIGILTALITTNLQSARSRARDTRRKSDLRAIEQSLRLYYNDHKAFPRSDISYRIVGCSTPASACSWGGPFSVGTTIYISSLPTDPSSNTATPVNYKYYSTNDDKYLLVGTLENKSDPDIEDSHTRCKTALDDYTETETDFAVCAQ